jgi:hypothetical protein
MVAKSGNQINLKENKKDNNQGILKLTNYFDSKLGNVCGIARSTYVCMYIIVLTNICHRHLMLSKNLNIQGYEVRFRVLNATFNNISAIS